MADWADLESALRGRLDAERLSHSYRVLETAQALGHRYRASPEGVRVAALMHDYARQLPGDRLLAEATRRGLVADPSEQAQPLLLHGPVAAAELVEAGLVTDPDVLAAIRYHTTGRAHMSLLERVIWLADYLEPARSFPGVEEIRTAAELDLNRALLMALDSTVRFVVERGWQLHEDTVRARNWLLRS